MLLELEKIRRDGGTQPRERTDHDTVTEYSEAMGRGEVFPAVRVIYDGESYWLVDGFHRIEAAERCELPQFECEVLQGTQVDAQWMSFGVNSAHGLQRTRWDVQRAITAALQHPMSAGLSDRAIAEHIKCDHKTVGAQRKRSEAIGEVPQRDTRTGSDGRVVNVSKIVPAIEPPAGGWPERDEYGSFSTEAAEPIFENKGHAQAVIHVLEIAPLSYEPAKHRWIANAALVGVAGCGLSKPLIDGYGEGKKTREAAIASAAQELAEHILRCLQNDKLPESRQSALRHFFAWADTQGANHAKAEETIKEEAANREAKYLEHAEQVLQEMSGLIDPRWPAHERDGAYDWQKFLTALRVVLERGEGRFNPAVGDVPENIDAMVEHFALLVNVVREFNAREVAA